MIKAGLYLKLLWVLKTPLIFLLDNYYTLFSGNLNMNYRQYRSETFDCDDYAFEYKGRAGHGVGLVFGNYKGTPHAWNVALTVNGIFQVEPQNGMIFKRDKDYIPIVVIM